MVGISVGYAVWHCLDQQQHTTALILNEAQELAAEYVGCNSSH
jgi:hypothetical protein